MKLLITGVHRRCIVHLKEWNVQFGYSHWWRLSLGSKVLWQIELCSIFIWYLCSSSIAPVPVLSAKSEYSVYKMWLFKTGFAIVSSMLLSRPGLGVIVVKKRINTRFFQQNGRLENPMPGTVVDSVVTRPEWWEFDWLSMHCHNFHSCVWRIITNLVSLQITMKFT